MNDKSIAYAYAGSSHKASLRRRAAQFWDKAWPWAAVGAQFVFIIWAPQILAFVHRVWNRQ